MSTEHSPEDWGHEDCSVCDAARQAALDALAGERDALADRVAELVLALSEAREALKPFAQAEANLHEHHDGAGDAASLYVTFESQYIGGGCPVDFTVGDLRRAREVLAQGRPK